MYKCVNGWTKEKMKEAIRAGNNGTRSAKSDDPDSCLYRGDNGNKCAIGCFMPDDFYNRSLEGFAASHFVATSWVPIADIVALSALQICHDKIYHDDPRPACYAWIDENVED